MEMREQGSVPPPYPGPPVHPPVTTQPYLAHMHTGPTTTIIQPTLIPVMIPNPMGYEPTFYTCRSCHQQMVTRVERQPACRTHMCAGILCLIGFWPCVCLPYCVNACNNADHYCTHCGSYVGSYLG